MSKVAIHTAPNSGFVLTVGDSLIALLPDSAGGIEDTSGLVMHTGGAELNTVVGLSRLGVFTSWLGRLGDDPLGRRVLRTLADEGVDTTLVVHDPSAPTGLYLREWRPDGMRRPFYYRKESAGSRLAVRDWPDPWPDSLAVPDVLHVTGITLALSDGASDAVESMVEKGRDLGCMISFDPNYRQNLWPDAATARAALCRLVDRADLVMLSEEDAELLVASTDPDHVLDAVSSHGPQQVVFKRGAKGAVASRGHERVTVAAEPVAAAVDPVGAGDAFNAGFLAATLADTPLHDAVRLGAFCGARAVEHIGEHTGSPRSADLPPNLRSLLLVSPSQKGSVGRSGSGF